MEIDLFALNYEAESQLDGLPTQAVTLLHPELKPLPISVFLMATQKTRATKTTINVYSTKPWPFSSTSNRLKSSLIWFHPLCACSSRKIFRVIISDGPGERNSKRCRIEGCGFL